MAWSRPAERRGRPAPRPGQRHRDPTTGRGRPHARRRAARRRHRAAAAWWPPRQPPSPWRLSSPCRIGKITDPGTALRDASRTGRGQRGSPPCPRRAPGAGCRGENRDAKTRRTPALTAAASRWTARPHLPARGRRPEGRLAPRPELERAVRSRWAVPIPHGRRGWGPDLGDAW